MAMKFDNTVTLGNLLTAVSMLLAGAGLYSNLNARLAVLEQAQLTLTAADVRNEREIRDVRTEIRAGFADIKTDIRETRQTLAGDRAPPPRR